MSAPRTRVVATRQTVKAACDTLFDEGARITGAAIMERLGGGSPNGIYKYIDEWFVEHRDRFLALQEQASHPAPPDVPAELWEAMAPVWERLVATAQAAGEASIAPQRRELEVGWAALERDRRALQDQLDTMRRDREESHARIADLQTNLEAAKAEIARLQGQHSADAAALTDARDTIAALTKQSATDRDAFTRQLSEIREANTAEVARLREDHARQTAQAHENHVRETDRLMVQLDRERQQAAKRERDALDKLATAERKLQEKSDDLVRAHQALAKAQAATHSPPPAPDGRPRARKTSPEAGVRKATKRPRKTK